MSKPAGLRVRRDIWLSEISWSKVHAALCHHFHISDSDSKKLINAFRREFARPLNLYWFRSSKLSVANNLVLAAVCESQGADIVLIRHKQPLWLSGLSLSCGQKIEFYPELRQSLMRSQPGTFTASMNVNLGARSLELNSFKKLLVLQALSFCLALVFYVLLVGIFLYSLSVFVLFLESPWEVAATATRNGSMALALLSFLVFSAAVCGRVIAGVIRAIAGRFLGRFLYGKSVHSEKCARRI